MSASRNRHFPFSATERIKRPRDFMALKAKGERLALGCLIANWQRAPGQERSRLGVVTSSRIGSAVVRNRARRLLRESFHLHAPDFTGPADLVLVARPSIAGKRFHDVERDFLSILRRAGLVRHVVENPKQ